LTPTGKRKAKAAGTIMDRKRHSIKQMLSVLIVLLADFVGCEKADRILEAADNANTLKEDMD
jgi:hypothetical protein